ncbi:thioredoxin family protein [Bacillus sp. CLL-7-23]|uniref:Thioredoxin family protein n=1 Tax=Bacillus changyiensis TaxID=3004103 RepID=A0ABT4X4Q2_9BACI|nr:thioredoxin family protein [Bacillus changyiensis]MDA1477659.1 thioredoxin family protein [Bacillus changyiensis]MDA7027274.1 thioredoxin family protein [Bacillus changyiensis]
MKKIETAEELEKSILSDLSLLMFSADWCPDCRFVDPFLPELEANFPEFTFYYVDRDQFIDTCAEWDIFGIPSFLVFKNGKEISRFVNKDRKTKDEIEQFLNDSLKK